MCCLIILQKTIYGANVVIFEGILAFEKKELRDVRENVVVFVVINVFIMPHSNERLYSYVFTMCCFEDASFIVFFISAILSP